MIVTSRRGLCLRLAHCFILFYFVASLFVKHQPKKRWAPNEHKSYCAGGITKALKRCPEGCQPGYVPPSCVKQCNRLKKQWGLNCSKTCPKNCRNGYCTPISGSCDTGCERGYRDTYCNITCDGRSYDYSCIKRCSSFCKGKCSPMNGACECKPGYTSQRCDKRCQSPKFGQDCRQTCSSQCQGPCHHVRGTCAACQPGYTSSRCTEKCPAKTYGLQCTHNCSVHCNGTCHHVTGTCNCLPGYVGTYCNEKCPPKTFGQDCRYNCSDHCRGQCHHISGTCTSCSTGYTSAKCDKRCSRFTYGQECQSNCSAHCAGDGGCDHIEGACLMGCERGFVPPLCKDICPSFTYGNHCTEQCNDNCAGNGLCHHLSGVCHDRCKPGFQTPTCEKPCDPGHFGRDCSQDCYECKKNTTTGLPECAPENGYCILGCEEDTACYEGVRISDNEKWMKRSTLGGTLAIIVIGAIVFVRGCNKKMEEQAGELSDEEDSMPAQQQVPSPQTKEEQHLSPSDELIFHTPRSSSNFASPKSVESFHSIDSGLKNPFQSTPSSPESGHSSSVKPV